MSAPPEDPDPYGGHARHQYSWQAPVDPYAAPQYSQPPYGSYSQPPPAGLAPQPYGYPPYGVPPATAQNNGMAIASLVCALVGLTGLGFVLGPVAVVLGIAGLSSSERDGGRGVAMAGIVIGAIETLLTIALVVLFVGLISAASYS